MKESTCSKGIKVEFNAVDSVDRDVRGSLTSTMRKRALDYHEGSLYGKIFFFF